MSSHHTSLGISRSGLQPTRRLDSDSAGVCRRIYPQIESGAGACQAAQSESPIDGVRYQVPGAYPKADGNEACELMSAVATPANQPISRSRRPSNASAGSAVIGAATSGLYDDVHTLQKSTDTTQTELATRARHARLDAAINQKPSIFSPALVSSAIGQIADFISNIAVSEGANMAVTAWTSTIEQSSRTFRLKEDVELFKPRLPDKDMVGAYMNRERGCFALNDASLSKFCVLDLEIILKDAESEPLSGDVPLGVQNNRSQLTAIFQEAFHCCTQKHATNEKDFIAWLEAGRFGDHEDVAVAFYYEATALERARCHVYALVHSKATRSAVIEAVPGQQASTKAVDETSDELSTQDQALFLKHVESMGFYQ